MGPVMLTELLVGSGGGAAAGGAADGGVTGGATDGATGGSPMDCPPGRRVAGGATGGSPMDWPPGNRVDGGATGGSPMEGATGGSVMVGSPGTEAGGAAGFSVVGNTGAGEPREGKVSKGLIRPILMVSCACMPAGARAPCARMTVRMALHQLDDRNGFGILRCWKMEEVKTLNQRAQGLRHSLESNLEAEALSAMVSDFGSHFKPVLPLRRAMFARWAMVMLRCETSTGVAVGLPS